MLFLHFICFILNISIKKYSNHPVRYYKLSGDVIYAVFASGLQFKLNPANCYGNSVYTMTARSEVLYT